MKIIGWGHYDYDAKDDSQKEYRELDDPNPQETYMNLCDEIRKHGYKFDGPYHQDGKMGTPIIEGGLYMTFSYRGWGAVMADAWSSADRTPYDYMDFYMMDQYSDEFKTPEYELPDFVRPERPIQTKPNDCLEKLCLTSSVHSVKKSIDKISENIQLIEKLSRAKQCIFPESGALNLKLNMNELRAEIDKLATKYDEVRKSQVEFYSTHPEFDPNKITTLVSSSDAGKSVRVYGPYAKMTYEEVMTKYPVETRSDNELDSVFPGWNRFEHKLETESDAL